MHALLIALGSHGDVHPFVGIGLGLRARGHRVSVVAYSYFQQLIEDAGLGFISCGSAEEFKRVASDPRAWKRFEGTRTILGFISALIEPIYEIVRANYVAGETVVVASSLALGARVAQDQLGVPTVSVHLQPTMFRSVIDPSYLQGLFMPPWLPRWMKQAQFTVVDWAVLDRVLGKPLNAFRAKKGLPAVRCVLGSYAHSPQRVIGMFPAWFAPPAPDWPSQTRLTGFPLYDETGVTALPRDLDAFLDAGEAPIAFTPGSAMFQGRSFFEESVGACEMLGRRGLLLSRHHDHIPLPLPPGVRHVEFAPFSQLLPRCAALVHHGGIGTLSQALRAGTPQLVVPHAHDQPDNAVRLVRLGVAKKLEVKEYRRGRIAATLGELIGSPLTLEKCREVRGRFENVDAIGETCGLIEEVGESILQGARDRV